MGTHVEPETSPSPDDNDKAFSPRRTNRFFCEQGHWYFHTREGYDIGPYGSMDECQLALEYFVENITWPDQQQLQSFTRRAARSAKQTH